MNEPRSTGATKLLRVALLLLAAAIFVRVLAAADLPRVLAHVARLGPSVVVIALPYLLVIGFDALAWRWIFALLGRELSFARLLFVRLSTEAVLLSVPGGAVAAETLKPVLLARRGVPVAQTMATLAAKKVLLVGTQALYLALAALLGWSTLSAISDAVLHRSGLPWMVLATALILALASLGLFAIFLWGAPAARSHALLSRIPGARLQAFFAARRSGFARTDAHLADVFGGNLAKLALCAGPFFASWLAESLESWTILHLLSASLSFREVMAFEAVVSLLRSVVFFVPAGLGVQDAGYMAALRGANVGNPIDLAAAFVLLKRAKEVCWIGIGYALLALQRHARPATPSTDVER